MSLPAQLYIYLHISLSLGRFISVSNSLPKTSYVKMIDIWLLFNLVLPFAEVSCHPVVNSIYSFLCPFVCL